MTQIVSGDILLFLSRTSIGSGFANVGFPGLSWGGYITTTQVAQSALLDNLFTDITGPENAGLQVDYACAFVMNNTTSGNSMLNAIAWLPTTGYNADGATVALAADPTGTSVAAGTSTAQAVSIGSNVQAPPGITEWAGPSSTNAGGVQLGVIPPGYCCAVWFQRTAVSSLPVNNDGFVLEVDFSTNG